MRDEPGLVPWLRGPSSFAHSRLPHPSFQILFSSRFISCYVFRKTISALLLAGAARSTRQQGTVCVDRLLHLMRRPVSVSEYPSFRSFRRRLRESGCFLGFLIGSRLPAAVPAAVELARASFPFSIKTSSCLSLSRSFHEARRRCAACLRTEQYLARTAVGSLGGGNLRCMRAGLATRGLIW